MFVESGKSQIDEKSYLPLILVKNGVCSRLFTDGLVDSTSVKKLRLPSARYDYELIFEYYDFVDGSVKTYSGENRLYVEKGRTEIEINLETTGFVTIRADLITKEM